MPHRKLVLIVDDVPTNLAVAAGALKELFRTKVATNGAKALKIASGAEKPDLVLLDVMMPDMDGYEVCRRLKANPDTATIPIVFITAKTSEDDRAKGIEAGAIDYIHKPFEAPVLIERVQAHLARQSPD